MPNDRPRWTAGLLPPGWLLTPSTASKTWMLSSSKRSLRVEPAVALLTRHSPGPPATPAPPHAKNLTTIENHITELKTNVPKYIISTL